MIKNLYLKTETLSQNEDNDEDTQAINRRYTRICLPFVKQKYCDNIRVYLSMN